MHAPHRMADTRMPTSSRFAMSSLSVDRPGSHPAKIRAKDDRQDTNTENAPTGMDFSTALITNDKVRRKRPDCPVA